jgi:hypothetical protein
VSPAATVFPDLLASVRKVRKAAAALKAKKELAVIKVQSVLEEIPDWSVTKAPEVLFRENKEAKVSLVLEDQSVLLGRLSEEN